MIYWMKKDTAETLERWQIDIVGYVAEKCGMRTICHCNCKGFELDIDLGDIAGVPAEELDDRFRAVFRHEAQKAIDSYLCAPQELMEAAWDFKRCR